MPEKYTNRPFADAVASRILAAIVFALSATLAWAQATTLEVITLRNRTAEQIKMEIGSAFPLDQPMTMEIKGRHLIEGVPKTITITDEEIVERLIYALVNEAAYILEEGIALKASDIDGLLVHSGPTQCDQLPEYLGLNVRWSGQVWPHGRMAAVALFDRKRGYHMAWIGNGKRLSISDHLCIPWVRGWAGSGDFGSEGIASGHRKGVAYCHRKPDFLPGQGLMMALSRLTMKVSPCCRKFFTTAVTASGRSRSMSWPAS